MTERLKRIFRRLTRIRKTKVQTSMKVIYCYGGGLAIMTVLMIGAWLWLWIHTGSPDLKSLVEIFKEYTAPAVVAAFTFVSVFCVDKDGDGRPDAATNQASETKQKNQ